MLNFLYGPLLYIAVAVFVIGMIARVVLYIKGLSQKLDRVAYKPQMGLGLQGALHSIFKMGASRRNTRLADQSVHDRGFFHVPYRYGFIAAVPFTARCRY